MEALLSAVRGFGANLDLLAAMLLSLVVLETIGPVWGAGPSLKSRLKSAMFWVVYGLATMAFAFAWRPLIGPLFHAPAWPVLAPEWLPEPWQTLVAVVLAAFVGDFFYYWAHRAQHTIPFLWRFHAVHHSVREMSGVTAYHHFTEPMWKAVLYSLPLSFVTRDPFGLGLMGFFLMIQGHYLHSTTKLNFGPLGWIIQDNRFHRVHHSIQPEHHDKNFAVFTTLWDWLFRTAVFPKPGEWPETGVEDVPEPENVWDFLTSPLRSSSRPLRSPARSGQPS